MLDVLTLKSCKTSVKISVKTAISVFLIALAVALPQLIHSVAGAAGGMKFLPMYLPVLIGGCVLGTWWGLGIGVLAPIVSFGITALAGNAMPALTRLPFMVVELAVFAAVSGLFSKKIVNHQWLAFPAVLLAEVSGRAVFLALAAIFGNVSVLNATVAWTQIKAGWIGLVAQAIIVPLAVIALTVIMQKSDKKESK